MGNCVSLSKDTLAKDDGASLKNKTICQPSDFEATSVNSNQACGGIAIDELIDDCLFHVLDYVGVHECLVISRTNKTLRARIDIYFNRYFNEFTFPKVRWFDCKKGCYIKPVGVNVPAYISHEWKENNPQIQIYKLKFEHFLSKCHALRFVCIPYRLAYFLSTNLSYPEKLESLSILAPTSFRVVDLGPQRYFLRALSNFKKSSNNLRAINLVHCRLTDDLLSILSEVKYLTKLDISRNEQITEQGRMGLFEKAISLKFLNLSSNNQIFDESCICLAEYLKRLESLNINDCNSISNIRLIEIAKHCSNITYLNISSNPQFTYEAIVCIALNLPDLKTLIGHCMKLNDRGLCEIAKKCPKITNLDVSYNIQLTDESFLCVAENLQLLQTLNISGCLEITDGGLCQIATHCQKFQNLFVSKIVYDLTWLTEEGIMHLSMNCPQMKTIALDCQPVTDKTFLSLVSNLHKLEEISIYNCRVSNDVVEKVKNEYVNLRLFKTLIY